jgi:flavin-dependent dehydrogenase
MSRPAAVIAGAGPAGAAAALGLARGGHDVVVLDGARFPRDKTCGEGLLPSGVAVLRRLGLAGRVRDSGAPRLHGVTYRHMRTGDAVTAAFPTPCPGDQERWGLGVRRLHFDAILVDALRNEPRVTVLDGRRATGVVRAANGAIQGVTTDRGPVLARVTIAADGLASTLRRAAGWPARIDGPHRYGVTGHWRVAAGAAPGITVSFDDECEWYQAPVGSDDLLVSALAGRRVAGRIARDYERSARAAFPRLREAGRTSDIRSAGVFSRRPERIAGDGLFLVGDAAGYHDPATGEGIGLALLLGEAAAGIVSPMLDGGMSRACAEAAYARRHAALWRDRRRLTAIALLMATRPRLSRRAVSGLARRPQVVTTLLGISCGYWGFGRLSARDWLSLAGV